MSRRIPNRIDLLRFCFNGWSKVWRLVTKEASLIKLWYIHKFVKNVSHLNQVLLWHYNLLDSLIRTLIMQQSLPWSDFVLFGRNTKIHVHWFRSIENFSCTINLLKVVHQKCQSRFYALWGCKQNEKKCWFGFCIHKKKI